MEYLSTRAQPYVFANIVPVISEPRNCVQSLQSRIYSQLPTNAALFCLCSTPGAAQLVQMGKHNTQKPQNTYLGQEEPEKLQDILTEVREAM